MVRAQPAACCAASGGRERVGQRPELAARESAGALDAARLRRSTSNRATSSKAVRPVGARVSPAYAPGVDSLVAALAEAVEPAAYDSEPDRDRVRPGLQRLTDEVSVFS